MQKSPGKNFGIPRRVEGITQDFKLAPKFNIIVNFAIIAEQKVPSKAEGLIRAGIEIDDRQASVNQGDMVVPQTVDINSLSVGTPMPQCLARCQQPFSLCWLGPEIAGDATHP